MHCPSGARLRNDCVLLPLTAAGNRAYAVWSLLSRSASLLHGIWHFIIVLLAMFYAVIFGNLTAIIQRLYSRTARYHRDVRVVNEFLAMHDMPESLQGNLREYFTNEQAAIRGDDIESVRQKPISASIEVKRVKWRWGWSTKTRMNDIWKNLTNLFPIKEWASVSCSQIIHFRVPKTLTLKTMLNAQSFFEFYLHANNHFQINSFALGLVFKQRLRATL